MLIFNFHYVDPVPKHADRKHISITPDGLANFIRMVRRMGMRPVSLREVITQGGPAAFEKNAVVLTFDDGYENFAQYAAPVLAEHQCPGTVFVLPGKFSGTNDWDQGHLPEAERDRLMSLAQVQSLAENPYITVGSHGLYHQNYRELSRKALEEEIQTSYAILKDTLGDLFIPVLAYPWGAYSQETLEVMEASSYQYALTTEKGHWQPHTPRFEVPRYSIYYRDGNPVILFAKLLRNGLLGVSTVQV